MPAPVVSGPPPVDTGEADRFYIRTPTSPADEQHLVLKQGETFAVFDRYGDIRPAGLAEQGLYHEGTRHLSELVLRVGGQRGLLLSSAVRRDNAVLTVDLTNLDMPGEGDGIPRGTLHIARTILLWDGTLHERLQCRNYGPVPIATSLLFTFDADYADIFEVRGTPRSNRGVLHQPVVEDDTVVLGYRGLDEVERSTRASVQSGPFVLGARAISVPLVLQPGAETTIDVAFSCEVHRMRTELAPFASALATAADALSARRSAWCEVVTSSQQFNRWIERSLSDLSMMITDTAAGPYPYAGVPWFSTPFGRDGIITALECLWAAPTLARGVLGFLKTTQATADDALRDAQPGKILHESRLGEMAALGEIPFGQYYGSHDATPLFVMLAASYFQRTADVAFVRELWPHIEAALTWIDRYGDIDGDGFVEYARQSPDGLVHQGWKDSHDSVFHADGRAAEAPIALAEIQGYVYAAWVGAAAIARALGRPAVADDLVGRAERLRERFDEAFWCPHLNTYALALDGQKQRCSVVSSNAGHALFSGIAAEGRAGSVAHSLLTPESFSGWGIRTLAAGQPRYNPMSYHNGSVWPHDNALIACGFSRYGLHDESLIVMKALFEASVDVGLHRLPELFCGFQRRSGESPTLYPVACNPQAWASASVFMLLEAVLGLTIDASTHIVRFTQARLPPFLNEVRIRNLRVGDGTVDLALERHNDDVGITVLHRDAEIDVIAVR